MRPFEISAGTANALRARRAPERVILAARMTTLATWISQPRNRYACFGGESTAVRMVNAAMPYLEASSAPTIVAVSSVS
jgi:hypothetical protein